MAEKEIAIRVKNIGKKYVIDHAGKKDNTLRDVLTKRVKRLVSPARKPGTTHEDVWALRNVSFDVYKGETLGIIGSNGAGKSTILKILSRIVEPSTGKFELSGRVGSLLEVGTGFHPELTGRENIYFNGSILGMTRKEINQRFQEIVDFAEVERFIDTPVKFYSSGMYVRLAFAIAAHLDPEVLIIDEALAVGDVAFQQKCIERMRDSARSGKTVLFVSHSMNIIEDLCDRVLYLKNGGVEAIGSPSKVVAKYLGTTSRNVGSSWKLDNSYVDKPENPIVPLSMKLLGQDGKPAGAYVPTGESVVVDMEIELKKAAQDLSVGVSVFNEQGLRLYRTAVTDLHESKRPRLVAGNNHLRVALKTDELLDGPYVVALDCDVYKKEWVHNPYFSVMRSRFFVKNDGSFDGAQPWDTEREAAIKPSYTWEKL